MWAGGHASARWTIQLRRVTLSLPPGLLTRSASLINAFGGEDVLGIDAAGVQTLLWLSDERGPSAGPGPFTEYFDVVLG